MFNYIITGKDNKTTDFVRVISLVLFLICSIVLIFSVIVFFIDTSFPIQTLLMSVGTYVVSIGTLILSAGCSIKLKEKSEPNNQEIV